jgi:hypothetical protein
MARSTAKLVIGGWLGAAVLALAGCATDRGSSVAIGDGAPAPAVTTSAGSGVVLVPLDPPSPAPGSPSASGVAGTPIAGSSGGGSGGGSGSASGATAGTGGGGGRAGTGGGTGASTSSGTGAGTGSPPPASGGGSSAGGSGAGGKSGGGNSSGGGTSGGGTGGTSGGTGAPQTPASLTVTALRTADTAQRWCQQVTLTLANSGDLAATSGTVTFATHVIGPLGIDWWTYRTSQPLAAPVAGHTRVDERWTVCLDAWRVPLGMHMETRAATLG